MRNRCKQNEVKAHKSTFFFEWEASKLNKNSGINAISGCNYWIRLNKRRDS